ncbi:bifunctional phosphopantothenoylcysteine decarboxylase/phosphopantothenate synthase [Leucobacter komagatae]|uniref:Coenzyme A biosynthesis bifunctional protein CoaBC n=1 Tax=Leucobacter komagatae TaxID=55969 RepID=A0A0D0IS03_9MICO|nr:bifunctional phosphopantothenoylcysteine decarboxylase/phosphopantothenate synthase [Leucobacter komagatae]KIP53762.1 phosphopantothenoylcysteine decarboxylase [Leucobacter komagatae]
MNIVLGVSGGIAAYKAVALARLLVEAGHDVHVVPTADALRFVGQPTWEAISRHPVTTSVHDDVPEVRHVALGQNADLVVVAPATANTLARMTAGLADDLLGTTLLATRAPVLVAPAMHTEMWQHPATQDNIAILRSRGVAFVGPESGRLTGDDSGQGRMSEPADIFARVQEMLGGLTGSRADSDAGAGSGTGIDAAAEATGLHNQVDAAEPAAVVGGGVSSLAGVPHPEVTGATADRDWAADVTGQAPEIEPAPAGGNVDHAARAEGDLAGVRVLVTAGGTREPIDPVRYLGNRSSGKQGVAIAAAAADRGAEVVLLAANIDGAVLAEVTGDPAIRVVPVNTTAELDSTAHAAAKGARVVVMAAAVADYRVADVADQKMRKEDLTGGAPTLTLVENPDILVSLVRDRQDDQVIVGFAAETVDSEDELLERGRRKLARKGVDLLAVNAVGWSEGFESADNDVRVLNFDGDIVAAVAGSKREVADALLDAVGDELDQTESALVD